MSADPCVLILGGTRSGKSHHAMALARSFPGRRALLATAQALDEEMAERIARHRLERPPDWLTLEEPVHLAEALRRLRGMADVVVLDCLTLWVSNLLMVQKAINIEEFYKLLQEILEAISQRSYALVMVSNEVGLGLVPANPVGRRYRDFLGVANQRAAEMADQVILMVAGIPLHLTHGVSHAR